LEDAPLALGLNIGPSVEFWVRLPLLKTQVHVAIVLGTTRGTNTKTPLTLPSCSLRPMDPIEVDGYVRNGFASPVPLIYSINKEFKYSIFSITDIITYKTLKK
jgi:hypothetical protein